MLGKQLIQAAAGSAAGGAALYVEDVFSTDLWPGTASAKTITTGIDLATEGGLVWIKNRTGGNPPIIRDTERGANKSLDTNAGSAEYTSNFAITAFTSSGFTLGIDATVNGSSFDFVGWTFRKAPGFFDCQTFTGNGSSTGDAQTISHNLGSTPGFVMIKRRSGAGEWVCWHRSVNTSGTPVYDNRRYLQLNSANGFGSMGAAIWGTVNSTGFEVKHNGTVGD